jgi:dienelactone hydrolase
MRRPVVAILFVALAVAGCGSRSPRITVTPTNATTDVPFTIDASGFGADELVTLRASGTSPSGQRWRGSIPARADRNGRVVLRDKYLLGIMRPVGGGVGPWPHTLTIEVRGAHANSATTARREPFDSTATKTMDLRPPQVGFYGEWLAPRDVRHHTAVLVFGGSDGDLPPYVRNIGSALAAHGYPVLELAYFLEPGLPQQLARIPLEYFRGALKWMQARPEVDRSRIASFGVSRGGELSLILASLYPRLIHAAVGYVPSAWVFPGYPDFHQPAWTLGGRPYIGVAPYVGRSTAIPVERIAGPVFVVGGGDDELWPSARSVRTIVQRMHLHGRHDVTGLVYGHAGHLVGTAVPTQNDAPTTIPLGWGGSPRADEQGREGSWPKLLRFLQQL